MEGQMCTLRALIPFIGINQPFKKPMIIALKATILLQVDALKSLQGEGFEKVGRWIIWISCGGFKIT
ncbi:MAG: hypothetical protein MZV64_27710 [Ignavibacteriales bacterium]|nr:hypothetical protein [Ignavibacteriales bacterium]